LATAGNTRFCIVSAMGKVDIGANLAIWNIISRLRQSDADFWEVFIDKGGCMVNILKLNESPAFSFAKVSDNVSSI
jgi:hypothetical protein